MYSARAARRSVELSFLAYSEDSQDLFDDGWDIVAGFGNAVSRGWVVSCQGIFFVVFAGTVSPLSENRGVLQWLAHLDFRQIDQDGGRVHGQWLYQTQSIIGQVINILDMYLPTKLFVCGHSYGGVLAQLSRRYLVDAGYTIDGIYTFGAPAVGNAAYAANQPANLIFRAERQLDIVSMTPLTLAPNQLLHEWMTFVSAGDNIIFQALGVQYKKAGTLMWLPGERSRPIQIDSLEQERLIQERRLAQLIGIILSYHEKWWLPVNDHDIWRYRSQYQVH